MNDKEKKSFDDEELEEEERSICDPDVVNQKQISSIKELFVDSDTEPEIKTPEEADDEKGEDTEIDDSGPKTTLETNTQDAHELLKKIASTVGEEKETDKDGKE